MRLPFAPFFRPTKKGKELLNDLNEFSEVTPFNLEEINLVTKQLLNANVRKEIIPTLTGLGDIASRIVNLSTGTVFLFTEQQNGKPTAQELNMPVGCRFFNDRSVERS